MNETKIIKPDGSIHTVDSFSTERAAKQSAEDTRLRDEALGLRPVQRGKGDRVPLYPRPASQRPSSGLVPHPQFNSNSSTYEFYGDDLTLETLTAHRRAAEKRGAFNMECLSTQEKAQLLHDCGFSLCGTAGVNRNGNCVQFQRWRLLLTRSGDGKPGNTMGCATDQDPNGILKDCNSGEGI